jgi:hypothetical protein
MPVSSSNSRLAATSGVSPCSNFPAGTPHIPASDLPLFLCEAILDERDQILGIRRIDKRQALRNPWAFPGGRNPQALPHPVVSPTQNFHALGG